MKTRECSPGKVATPLLYLSFLQQLVATPTVVIPDSLNVPNPNGNDLIVPYPNGNGPNCPNHIPNVSTQERQPWDVCLGNLNK